MVPKFRLVLALLMVSCGGTPEAAPPAPPTPEAPVEAEAPAVKEAVETSRVFFSSPKDGDTVTSPVAIAFGIEGMSVDPAGEVKDGSGHHHLIINGTSIERGTTVPANETHIHYGKGQTEASLELEPGDYSLTMQFANGAHLSYGEAMSAQLKLTVVASEEAAPADAAE